MNDAYSYDGRSADHGTEYAQWHPEEHMRDASGQKLEFGIGTFAFDGAGGVLSSSGRKRLYRGMFTFDEVHGGRVLPAVAIYFVSGGADAYVREIKGLEVGKAIGVGPKLICDNEYRSLPEYGTSGTLFPLLVEEDAGVSLESVLLGEPIPCERDKSEAAVSLREMAIEQRRVLACKLAFDVLTQVANIHAAHYFHRDIRCANIAVRFYGDDSDPFTVRATLLDFEFLTNAPRIRPYAKDYYNPLFANGSWCGEPTPCEQDAGYLAIVLAEIASLSSFPFMHTQRESVTDIMADGNTEVARQLARITKDPAGFFCYEEQFARPVAFVDVERCARHTNLPTVEQIYGTLSDRALSIADALVHHGGYLDKHDIDIIEQDSDMVLERLVAGKLSHQIWENYIVTRIRGGLPIEYERFEDQPLDLQFSNIDKARAMEQRVEELGYEIVLSAECPDDRRVETLSARQVEFVAEREHERWCAERSGKGWTLGDERDPAKKISPYLKPWSELTDEQKKINREAACNLISVIEQAGLAVRK